ncbi:glycosyltransferase [Methylobacterium sp. J-078]|uniref:glycosyltransferase n=1 Tax=Methylobacterium sp. J-078 TaxID=2836657 RepID=UPI001FBBF2CE|nr:glycosyltransferase [Methylobacterium sp. J-078]MCJ2043560.1 glycosyltransferase [Methylobacterium sp. J-078]
MKRLFIADPGFMSPRGHNADLSNNLCHGALELGIECHILTHRLFRESNYGLPTIPAFTFSPYDPPRWLRRSASPAMGPTISTLSRDLISISPRFSNSTVVFFHSASLSMLNDIIDYLLAEPEEETPCFLVRVMYAADPSGFPYPAWYIDQLYKKLRNSGFVGRKIILCSETRAMESYLSGWLGLPVTQLHHATAFATQTGPARKASAKNEPFKVTFLGEARREKGYDLLPQILKGLNNLSAFTAVELNVQCATNAIDPAEKSFVSSVNSEIDTIGGSTKVVYHKSHLSPEKYRDLIEYSDFIVLLHDPASYGLRGSAVFNDAVLSAKPFLVRRGTSMEQEADLPGMVTWDDKKPVSEQFIFAFQNQDQLKSESYRASLQWSRSCKPTEVISKILQLYDLRDRSPVPKTVLHVFPNWFGQGGSHVFRAHTDYLVSRGFRVIDIVVGTSESSNEAEVDFYKKLFNGTSDHSTFFTFHLQRELSIGLNEQSSHVAEGHNVPSFAQEARWLLDSNVPNLLARIIANASVCFSLINYAFNMPFASLTNGSKVILDSLDVRSHQYDIESGVKQSGNNELDTELAWMKRADGIIFINEAEKVLFEQENPSSRNNITTFPVCSYQKKETYHSNMSRLKLENFHSVPAEKRERLSQFMDDNGSVPRIVFVGGSSHLSNLISLDWFIREVLVRHFSENAFEFIVFGSIGESYPEGIPGVEFFGRIPHLLPILQHASAVILPIVEGTGLPIKSLDAVLAHSAVVATRKAFAGMPRAADFLNLADSDVEFATELRRVIEDSQYREMVRSKVQLLAENLLDIQQYHSDLDKIISQAGIEIDQVGFDREYAFDSDELGLKFLSSETLHHGLVSSVNVEGDVVSIRLRKSIEEDFRLYRVTINDRLKAPFEASISIGNDQFSRVLIGSNGVNLFVPGDCDQEPDIDICVTGDHSPHMGNRIIIDVTVIEKQLEHEFGL